jgi:hypothetical protein
MLYTGSTNASVQVRVQDQARRQPDAVPAAARPEIFRSE